METMLRKDLEYALGSFKDKKATAKEIHVMLNTPKLSRRYNLNHVQSGLDELVKERLATRIENGEPNYTWVRQTK
jgi:hypothetical protein